MSTAYSYIRFSSDKQTLGDSLRRQLDKAEAYAAKHNLTLDHSTYRDLGVSAFRGKNAKTGALGAFLQAVDSGAIPRGSILLFETFDRMSRLPVMEALALFQTIISKGITVITLTDEQIYNVDSLNENWTKLIIALAQMTGAHDENLKKSRRVKDAWDAKRSAGAILTSISPSWLHLSDGKWIVNKEKADVVRRIFKLAVIHGTPTIARMLNTEKVPTMLSASDWSSGVVASILKNRAVIGTYTPKKAKADPIENYYPAILKREVFDGVQEFILNRNRHGGLKGTGVANLFAGRTYCYCGKRARFVSASKPHIYVRCLSAYANAGCDATSVPYNALENDLLMWLVTTENSVQALTSTVIDPTLTAKSELVDLRGRLEKLLDLAETGSPSITKRILKLEDE